MLLGADVRVHERGVGLSPFHLLIGLLVGGAIGFGIGYLVFGKKQGNAHQQGFGQPQWGQQPPPPQQLQQEWGQPPQWQPGVQQPPQQYPPQPPQQHPPQQGFGQHPPR